MPKKANKSQPKASLEIAIKSAAGKHVDRISSVAKLKELLQQILPELDPYAAQAAAHLVMMQRANIDTGRWQIQIVGEWILQPTEVARKQGSKSRAKAAPPAESVPARDTTKTQPSPAPLFPEPQDDEQSDL